MVTFSPHNSPKTGDPSLSMQNSSRDIYHRCLGIQAATMVRAPEGTKPGCPTYIHGYSLIEHSEVVRWGNGWIFNQRKERKRERDKERKRERERQIGEKEVCSKLWCRQLGSWPPFPLHAMRFEHPDGPLKAVGFFGVENIPLFEFCKFKSRR